MRVGEEPIELVARRYLSDGNYYGGNDFTWSVSDESALRLTHGLSLDSCRIEPLKAVPGGVTLTVECMGASCSLTVYIVN